MGTPTPGAVSMANWAPALVVRLDGDGRILFGNRRWCDLVGYPEDELRGRKLWDFVSADDRQRVRDALTAPGASDSAQTFDAAIQTNSGAERIITWYAGLGPEEFGRAGEILAVGLDVTEQREAQKRLGRTDAVLGALHEMARLFFGGPARRGLLNQACNHLVTAACYDMAWVALVDDAGAVSRAFGAPGDDRLHELRRLIRRGEVPWCVRQALAQEDVVVLAELGAECGDCPMARGATPGQVMAIRLERDSQVDGVLAVHVPLHVAVDTHERRLLQQVAAVILLQVRRTESRARREFAVERLRDEIRLSEAFFEHTITPLAVLDKDLNFIRVNDAYAASGGRDPSEFPGLNHFALYPDDAAEQIFRDVVESKQPFQTFARPFVYPDQPERGITYWNWTLVPVLDDDGEVAMLILSLEDVTERARAVEALRTHEGNLRALAAQLPLVHERERRALAGELHDTLGHLLTLAKMKLDTMAHVQPPGPAAPAVDEIRELIERAIDYTGTLTAQLSPSILYDLGLQPAVEWLADQHHQQHAMPVHVHDDGQPKNVGEDVAVVLFHALRELLMNVVKHAEAEAVRISLSRAGGELQMEVQDDGVGFDPVAVDLRVRERAGFGLFNLRERLGHVGGRVVIHSQPGQGTRILMTVPCVAAQPRTEE